tara:strand:+ start:88 stop:1731 length:1644 start_codon:yes stop_codon:yes gene_type:complete
MTIKRYVANADTTITNAFEANLTTRGTGSNMGLSDTLEVFSIYGQTVSGSSATNTAELSRTLVNFPVSTIATDRTNGDIPASGSVDFYLRMFNAEHSFSVPRNFTLSASAITKDWEEGYGLDMEGYRDLTDDGTGANWIRASESQAWTRPGADYDVHPTSSFEQTFTNGIEDLEMNITPLVEQWLNSAGNVYGDKSSARYGIGVYLTSSQEAKYEDTDIVDGFLGLLKNPTGSTDSYYTKKFFARGSEYFFKRPLIEARWDSSKKDNRDNFYLSSSLATGADNLNTLYLYNYVRGQLKNIPNLGGPESEGNATRTKLEVKIYPTLGGAATSLPVDGVGSVTRDGSYVITASYVDTGIYSASFAYTGSETTIYDVWITGSSGTGARDSSQGAGAGYKEFHTGSAITVKTLDSYDYNPNDKYVTSIPNLKSIYSNKESGRFRLFTRKKDWSPTIYSKATADAETEIIEDAYYKVYRIYDDLTVIDYGTGSLNHTRMSYDMSGSYFDLDMSMFEADYMYGIKVIYYLNDKYMEQPKVFKFRVEKDLTDIE